MVLLILARAWIFFRNRLYFWLVIATNIQNGPDIPKSHAKHTFPFAIGPYPGHSYIELH